MTAPKGLPCRLCGAELSHTFVDLGATPLANAYLSEAQLGEIEPCYPLHVRICAECLLVQLPQIVRRDELFGDYAYFSSYSTSWVERARRFTEASIARFALDGDSMVVEVASNDGYLLKHFVDAGIPVLGIEPAANVAAAAVQAGVPTEVGFFGAAAARDLVARGYAADLLVGNNVLAHVPDLNDFVSGLAAILKPGGVLSLEFPHLMRLIDDVQFDTIYHEHFSYFSFLTAERALARHGLAVFDVEQLPTHGGSLRVYAGKRDGALHQPDRAIAELREVERAAKLDRLSAYTGFTDRVAAVRAALLEFLKRAKDEGRTVVAYGAAAKGNTLLNTCGIDRDLVAYAVDRSPHKQGRYLPGSRLPIHPPERIFSTRPNYILILPWNLKEEIMAAMAGVREWGGRFVVPIPRVKVLP